MHARYADQDTNWGMPMSNDPQPEDCTFKSNIFIKFCVCAFFMFVRSWNLYVHVHVHVCSHIVILHHIIIAHLKYIVPQYRSTLSQSRGEYSPMWYTVWFQGE